MNAIADPLVDAAPLARVNSGRVTRRGAVVVGQRPLNHDTVELVVACTPAASPVLARAGQFASLTFADLGATRAYSFARDPLAERPGEHTFYIRRVPGGAVSAWLERDRLGAQLEVAGPLGRFVLDEGSDPMLLVAGGSGLSAIKALAEEAGRRRLARDCLVIHGARAQADLYAGEAFARVAARWHPDHEFRFVQVLSEEPAASGWAGPRGLVSAFLDRELRRGSAVARQPVAWVCGPPPMIAATEDVLGGHGVPPARVHRDLFTDLRSPAPRIDNGRCALCDECLLVRPVSQCIVESNQRLATHPPGATIAPLVTGRHAGLYYQALVVDESRCLRCYACLQACPHDAIRLPTP